MVLAVWSRWHRLLVALAVIGWLSGVADVVPARASVVWSGSQVLGSVADLSQDNLNEVALGGSATGYVAAVWAHAAGISLAVATPGRPFSGGVLIPGSQGVSVAPNVTVDDRGDVALAWTVGDGEYQWDSGHDGQGWLCCDRVHVAMLRPGGRLLDSVTVTPARAYAQLGGLAIAPNGGTVAVAYGLVPVSSPYYGNPTFVRVQPYGLQVRTARFGRPFGPQVSLGATSPNEQVITESVRASTRNATVEYAAPSRGAASDVWTTAAVRQVRVSLGGRVQRTTSLGTLRYQSNVLGTSTGDVGLAADGHGDLAALLLDPGNSLQLDRCPVGGHAFAPVSNLASPAESGLGAAIYAVAPSGLTLFSWASGFANTAHLALGQLRTGAFANPITIRALPAGARVDDDAAAINSRSDGMVTLSWVGHTRSDVLVAVPVTPTGQIQTPVPLSGAADYASAEAQTVIDEHGRGAVIWISAGARVVLRRFAFR